VRQRSKLRQSLARLCNILFPELESAVSTLHLNCIYAMLLKYPSAKDKEIRNLARKSVGVYT